MRTLIEVKDLSVHFSRQGSDGKGTVRALDGVNFTVGESESLGVIGESGQREVLCKQV